MLYCLNEFLLKTQVGELYRLDVFVAERFKCDSNLLLETSGTQFVREWEESLPADYMADISENLQIGALVQVRSDRHWHKYRKL